VKLEPLRVGLVSRQRGARRNTSGEVNIRDRDKTNSSFHIDVSCGWIISWLASVLRTIRVLIAPSKGGQASPPRSTTRFPRLPRHQDLPGLERESRSPLSGSVTEPAEEAQVPTTILLAHFASRLILGLRRSAGMPHQKPGAHERRKDTVR